MFLKCNSTFVIFGGGAGSGKSHQALMKVLKYIKDPNYKAIFVRQTSTQLTQLGGLWQEAQKMWREYGAVFKMNPLTATFPSGATVQFKVCSADRDIYNFDGGQFTQVYVDEAQWHSKVQLEYLQSRIRSEADAPHQMINTCNPSRTSYLYQFVKWYLDLDTGIPLAERSGTERYFATVAGEVVTADTAEELIEAHGEGCKPQTYTYICATVKDNPIYMKLRPEYVNKLENLPRKERERLYLGSWHAKEEASQLWKREWVPIIDRIPEPLSIKVRGYDLAATIPSEVNPKPDWTCGVLIGKGKNTGHYYILDAVKYQQRPDGVIKNIITQAIEDGDSVQLVLPKDGGAGGTVQFQYYAKLLAEAGVAVKKSVVSGHSGKLLRFAPFSSLCESGNVSMLQGEWNDWYMECLEDFDGRRGGFDDPVDATSDAANFCMRAQSMPIIVMPDMTQPSPIPRLT